MNQGDHNPVSSSYAPVSNGHLTSWGAPATAGRRDLKDKLGSIWPSRHPSSRTGHSKGDSCITLEPKERSVELEQDFFPDVVLVVSPEDSSLASCGSVNICGHRVVLAGHSKYFKALFSSGMRETGLNYVELKEDHPDTLKQLVASLYCHTLDVQSDEGMARMLEVATKYQISALQKKLEAQVLACVSVRNLKTFYEVAEKLQLEQVMARCSQLCQRCLEEANTSMGQVPLQLLVRIIKKDDLACTEEELVRKLASWLQVNRLHGDKDICMALFQEVRFENLTPGAHRLVLQELSQLQAPGSMADVVQEVMGKLYVQGLTGKTRPLRKVSSSWLPVVGLEPDVFSVTFSSSTFLEGVAVRSDYFVMRQICWFLEISLQEGCIYVQLKALEEEKARHVESFELCIARLLYPYKVRREFVARRLPAKAIRLDVSSQESCYINICVANPL